MHQEGEEESGYIQEEEGKEKILFHSMIDNEIQCCLYIQEEGVL